MPEIVGPARFVSTSMPLVAAHVSHLTHLTKPAVLESLLVKQHKWDAGDIASHAQVLATHIAQGLAFHSQGRTAAYRIRPVLQYYSFLNLAVACIMAYQPRNWKGTYRYHGVRDKTAELSQLEFDTPIIEVTRGAVSLFSEIISCTQIVNQLITLRRLCCACPFLGFELENQFEIVPYMIDVSERLEPVGDTGYVSCVEFDRPTQALSHLTRPDNLTINDAVHDLEVANPYLPRAYERNINGESSVSYKSRKSWSATQRDAADRAHRRRASVMINFGGHGLRREIGMSRAREMTVYRWWGAPGVKLLPTLSACLLLSFAFSSIMRYRAVLVDSLERSRLFLLFDVFVNEVDSVMIPAFRNLLFREELAITQSNQ